MNVVGMVSAYKEGRLVHGAINSLLKVELDGLYVYEGPAGEPLGDDVPDSEYLTITRTPTMTYRLHRGRWRTDARKRDAMLQQAKKDFPSGPLWGVIVDGDEILVNGEYLRDRLQLLVWDDAHKGASASDPENPPWARWPLHLIESDGSMSLITARVVRLDLLRSIDISSSVVTNTHGVREGWGNYAAASALWIEGWLKAIDEGKMIAWPPLPAEPHLLHRSNLRHPLRRGLRMSTQEGVEFAKAQQREGHGNGS